MVGNSSQGSTRSKTSLGKHASISGVTPKNFVADPPLLSGERDRCVRPSFNRPTSCLLIIISGKSSHWVQGTPYVGYSMKSHPSSSRIHLTGQFSSTQGSLINFAPCSVDQEINMEESPSVFPLSPRLGGWRWSKTNTTKDVNTFGEPE